MYKIHFRDLFVKTKPAKTNDKMDDKLIHSKI